MTIVRTKKHGCWELVDSRYWGKYLRPTTDPEGQDISRSELNSFELKEDFPRLSKDLMRHIITLMKQFSIEVQVILARNESNINEWRVFVPEQGNTAASVEADTTSLVDIVTGEEFSDGIPFGWVTAGTAHSHCNMSAFWSSTDDKSELNQPGLHFTIGGHNWAGTTSYTICTSICLNGVRHVVHPSEVIDIEVTLKERPALQTVQTYTNGNVAYSYTPYISAHKEYHAESIEFLPEMYTNVLNQVSQAIVVLPTYHAGYQSYVGYNGKPFDYNAKIKSKYKSKSKGQPAHGNALWHEDYNEFMYSRQYFNNQFTHTTIHDIQMLMDDFINEGGDPNELKQLLMEYVSEVQ